MPSKKPKAQSADHAPEQQVEQAPGNCLPILSCPPELSAVARREWDRVTSELIAMDRVTGLDRAALAAYCVAYSLWIEAVDGVQKYGSVMKSPSGFPVQSPYLSIANRQAELMMRVACEFGFTPASRARITKPESTDLLPLDLEAL